ncbi:hypothetical protein B0O80DRAFT_165575 [Mortierella sp. GBAus27b]|nr:hypothetical protein B0O80DRAFT_165575 [Mortierella sp. GBAus27b]
MTTTINEHIRLLSTAVGNLWTGSIYKKSLDYLLRILLRLHLAPDRESKYWNRTHVAVQKQAQVKETNLKKSRKKWKSKLKKSCDRLAHLVSRGTNNDRAIGAVLRSLNNIASQRPVSIQTKIPNIECRLAEMAMGTVIDEPVCPDLDGEDEDGEEDDEGRGDEVAMEIDDEEAKPKEPSRARLRSLQAVLKMLVESPNISHDINWSWVKKSGYKGNDFTEKECRVVAYLANLLRLFIPKRRPRADGKGYQDSLAHVALRAPIVLIANSVLRAAGYPEFTRRNAPQTSSASLHGLQLGAVGLYEAFCGRGERQFDVQDASKNPLTNYITLQSSPENKRAIFESFFNMRKVEKVCSDHGLTFRDRITYVDEWTIRLTGSVVAHGANRSGYPVVSAYDERKKRFQEQADTWVDKFIDSGLNAEKVKELAEVNEACTKQLEDDIKPFRKVVKERQTIQSSISYEVGFGGSSYEELHSARDQLRQARRMLVPREEALRNQRQITYHYNKMAEAAEKLKDDQPKVSSVKTKKFSAPTWDLPAVEDSCEYLDLSKIVAESEAKNRAIALSGTDYGICKMSETVAMTLKGMQGHFARYDMLQGKSIVTGM